MSSDPFEGSPGTPSLPVLVVEDERSIAAFVAEVVVEAGHTPEIAANGREALRLVEDRWPALVITDMMMPHVGGVDLVRALRRLAAERRHAMPPVILMTAASSGHALSAEPDALLRKPFSLDELESLLHRFLG